jgi:predicted adenine nucleotide alpha hydrolase (AANH) superfamily ATPase
LSEGKLDHLAKIKTFADYLNNPNIHFVKQRELFSEDQVQLLLEFVVELCAVSFDRSWFVTPKKIDRMDSCVNMIVDKYLN